MFRGRRSAEEGKRAGCVAGGGPAGAAVEAHAFVCYYAEDAAAAKGFGVGLAFDLQDVEGEEDDFAYADYAVQDLVRFVRAGIGGIWRRYLPAVACMIALPLPLPKARSNWSP